MAFVFEKVPEKYWEIYNSFELSFDGKQLTANKYKWWTADKEKDIYLILLGGGVFDTPEIYVLIWNNNKIKIEVTHKCVYNEKSESVLHYRIEKIIAPTALTQNINELSEIIREAFACMIDCDFVMDYFANPLFLN